MFFVRTVLVSDSKVGMDALESEVLDFLATMADYVEAPLRKTHISLPSSNCIGVPAQNDRIYLPPLSLVRGHVKRKRTVPLGVNTKAPERKRVILFPDSGHFQGVHCSTTYVSLLQGHSKWEKSTCDTKRLQCGCNSVVSCTHSSSQF